MPLCISLRVEEEHFGSESGNLPGRDRDLILFARPVADRRRWPLEADGPHP